MYQATLFAFVPEKISNWLTPLWILGVGTLIGLAILMLFVVVAFALSRIPGLNRLANDPRRRNRAAAVLSVCVFLLLLAGIVVPTVGDWSQIGETFSENLVLAVFLLIPVSIALGFGLVAYCSRATVAEFPDAVSEGPLSWILAMAGTLAVFGIVGAFTAQDPTGVLKSLSRTPYVGEKQTQHVIPGTPREVLDDTAEDPPQVPIDVQFRRSELRTLSFLSNQSLTIDTKPSDDIDIDPAFDISPGEELRYAKTTEASVFEEENVTELYVRNYATGDATLDLTVSTAPRYPEASAIYITAIAVLVVFLAYLFQRAVMPRLSAVSLATFKSEAAQPLFMIVLVLGIVSLVIFIWIPYNTFGEDIKVLKDSGMTLIMVLCIIQAIWAASTSVADEIDGRTALTVLSKPIGRRSFIIGKYLGIFWTVAVLFIVLGIVLLICVAWKPIYDSREGAESDPTWQLCHLEMIRVVPGLALAFMETIVLAAISVAIATRLPMLANFIICFSVYVLGHLTPLVVQSSVSQFEPVQFVAELVATILPNLDHFNIQAAVAAGVGVPNDYLGWSLLYCLIYGVIALMLALVLFEDRDLA